MSNPLISVLLCTHNDALYICEAIESIINQSFKDFEFLIIDDGSTDETAAIIKSFSDQRIIYLRNPRNKGLEFSKNRGIEVARGKYIAYIDGDDISKRNRLQQQFSYMEANPSVGICGTALRKFGGNSGTYLPPQTDLEIRLIALFNTPMVHPSCMIRREVLMKNNIRYRMNFSAAEDFPFMVDVLNVSRAYNFSKALYLYRIQQDSVSLTQTESQQQSTEKGGLFAFKKLLGIEVTAAEKSSLRRLFYHHRKGKVSVPVQAIFDRVKIDENDSPISEEFKRFFLERGRKRLFRYEIRQKSGIIGLLKEVLYAQFKRKIFALFRAS